MKKQTLIASAVASMCLLSAMPVLAEDAAAPAAPPPPYTLTGNIGVVSDYVFRGVSQTHHDPALQGGFDFTHSSGFYVGTWLSSISWVSDSVGGSYPTEIDLYGGYRDTFATDFGYDLGFITYNYPGNGRSGGATSNNPDTQEVYASLSWKWLSAKYSYVTSDHFVGWGTTSSLTGDTRGSDYAELNAAYDLGDGWGISAHYGHQSVKDNDPASYSDWNVGATKDIGYGVVGLKYSDTNVSGNCYTSTGTTDGNAYCWGTSSNTSNFKNVADGTYFATFTKTF